MKHALLLVRTRPQPGKEKEYNDWYDNTHLGDLLACDGVVSAQRYSGKSLDNPDQAPEYYAVYEVEEQKFPALMERLAALAGEDKKMFEVLDLDRIQSSLLSPLSAKG